LAWASDNQAFVTSGTGHRPPRGLLLRRVRLDLSRRDRGLAAADEILAIMAPLLNWSEKDVAAQKEAYAQRVAQIAAAEAELTALDSVARDLSSSGQAGNTTATLKVVDSPTTPTSPSSLSAMSTALIGTAIGLAAGAIMAILLYFLSQKNPQDKVEDPLLIIGRRRSREDA